MAQYRVFKYTDKTWEGEDMAPERNGAPFYCLFEVYYNEYHKFLAKVGSPILYYDTLGETTERNPYAVFSNMLREMSLSMAMECISTMTHKDGIDHNDY